jgi:EmrB/QacA subfamily drug resistance transporter
MVDEVDTGRGRWVRQAAVVTTRAQAPALDRSVGAAPDPNRWLALTVVCLSVVVIVLDNSIMNVALPSIERTLQASASQLQWTVDAYTLVFAALLLTAGTIGDRFGRRGTLMAGLAIFGAGSALAAFSQDPTALIGFRALMGIGAAAIYPTTLSIITNMFEGAERGRAIGIWAALAGAGVALGPIVGGVLLDHWWWGSVLLVNVPVVAVSLVLLPMLVPTSRDPSAPRIDLVGVVLSSVGFAALLYGIIQGPHDGWGSAAVMLTLVGGVVVLAAFLLWERHTDHAMLQLSFFSNPRFSAASVALSLTFFALFGYIFLLTQYLQFVRDMTPLAAGLRLAPPAIGLALGAPVAPRIVERIGTKIVVATGLSTAALSMLLLSWQPVLERDGVLAVVFMLFGFGMGMVMAPATESIMGSVPRDRAGVGSAVNDTTRQTGGALGVAVLGSLFATRYNAHIDGLQLPPATASAAKLSIGNALRIAPKLPGRLGEQLVGTARAGFVSGIEVATLFGAAIVCIAVLIVVLWLPARGDDGPAERPGAG